MAGIARVGDMGQGICTGHKTPIFTVGFIINGVPTCTADGISIATITSIVLSSCGHTGTIVSGIPTILVQGKPAAKQGSTFSGTFSGTIVLGSPKVIGNG